MGVMRIGHANIRVMDMPAALKHYEEVIGMKVTHRDDKGNVYLKCWDEWDKYSLILSPADRAGLNYLAYKVEKDSDLDSLNKRIREYGIETEMLPEGALPLCGRSLRFKLPSEHVMYLFAKKEFVGKEVGVENPDPWPDGLQGVGAHWLDHCAINCQVDPEKGINKVAETTKFCMEVLDFYLGEQIMVGPNNSIQVATFLFRGSKPHDLALLPGPVCGLHHVSFFLDDWASVLKAGDIFSKKRVKTEMSPTRHGITRGETIYFFDPSGNRNETFGGLGYQAQPDMPTITWTEDNLGRGIFYHTREMVESFQTVYT